MIRGLKAAALVAFVLSGCAAPGNDLPPLETVAIDRYRLDSGDRLRIAVFRLDALSNDYVVNDSGAISMPLIGSVPARGNTVEELEEAVEARLREGDVLKEPNVSVQIESFRPFYILGEVEEPGQYPYVPGMTVLTAVSIAGGYTFRAETDHMAVTRRDGEEIVEGRATPRTSVLPGDTIYVRESWF